MGRSAFWIGAALVAGVATSAPTATTVELTGLSARDAAFDHHRTRLYASVAPREAGGSPAVVAVDPGTSAVTTLLETTDQPGPLALTDSGRFLYVGSATKPVIRRLDLETGTVDQTISLDEPVTTGEFAREVQTQAGSDDLIGVIRGSESNGDTLRFFRDGVALRAPLQFIPNISGLSRSFSPDRAYVLSGEAVHSRLVRISIAADEWTIVDSTDGILQSQGAGLAWDNGVVANESGRILDPELRKAWGDIPLDVSAQLQISRSDTNQILRLVPGRSIRLDAFDRETLTLTGSELLSGLSMFPAHLEPCDENTLAVIDSERRLALVRSALVSPPAPSANIRFQRLNLPAPLVQNRSQTYQLKVTNEGPAIARDVRVSEALPPELTLVSATPSQGVTFVSAGTLAVGVGTLAAGQSMTVSVTVRSSKTLEHALYGTAYSSLPDDVTGNNASSAVLPTLNPTGANLLGTWKSLKLYCTPENNYFSCGLVGTVRVTNRGKKASPKSTVSFYRSEDHRVQPDRDIPMSTVRLPALAPGKSALIKLSHYFLTTSVPSGEQVIALLDPQNQLGEGNEADNSVVRVIP